MSVNIKELKRYIYENKMLEELLESLDVQNLRSEQSGNLVVGQLPNRFNSSNRRAIQAKYTPSLPCYIRNRNDFKGDIINLVSYLEFDARSEEEYKECFTKTIRLICKNIGIKGESLEEAERRIDYALPLKNLMSKLKSQNVLKPNPPLPETLLENYDELLPLQWIKEGIDWDTLDEFGIRIDPDTNRAIIPIRNKRGQLIGTKGRLLFLTEEDEKAEKEKEYPRPKYLYLERCNTSIELFNFYRAKEYIEQEKHVFVFEGEKSVMKMWQAGYKNAVAIASSDFSAEQYRLIHECGSDVEIILCYDNDKSIEDIKSALERLGLETLPSHDIYMMLDREKMLPPKSSPIDSGVEVFEQLLENHIYNIA